ncbi:MULTISPECIES: 4'-phosphopantetheinyl transferase family protein [Chelatococcus]|nr:MULTISPECIES: 4'-phosphopantetheinyl transferase superfamily protein [Chelatococcus]
MTMIQPATHDAGPPDRWPIGPGVPPWPADGEVHVWSAALDEGDWAQAEGILGSDEVAKAARYRFAHDGARFSRARILRRLVLARYLGCAAGDIAFGETGIRRPCLADREGARVQGLDFNTSRSADMALIAVASGMRVGIDIEVARVMDDIDEIARQHFHVNEWLAIAGERAPAAKQNVFLRCWTRKEALTKAMGVGLHLPLHAFFVGTEPEAAPFRAFFDVDPSGQPGWWLTDLSVPPVYAALASDGVPKRLHLWRMRL